MNRKRPLSLPARDLSALHMLAMREGTTAHCASPEHPATVVCPDAPG